jgi:hypothetical protein
VPFLEALVLAAAPYVVGAIGWGSYILQAPTSFCAQFGGNLMQSAKVSGGLSHRGFAPIVAVQEEILRRYLPPFGLAAGVGLLNRLKGIVLVSLRTPRNSGGHETAAGSAAFRSGMPGRDLLRRDGADVPFQKLLLLPHTTTILAACFGLFLLHVLPAGRLGLAVALLAFTLLGGLQIGGLL